MLWDLRTSNEHPLSHWAKVVAQMFDRNKYYFIEPNLKGTQYIMVQDAATALEYLWWKLYQDSLACFLLWRGTEFSTWVWLSSNYALFQYPPIQEIGLGWHPPGYWPDVIDYTVYEEIRLSFLRSPWGQATFLKGSIVWCLTLHRVDFDTVLIGPTDDVDHGHIYALQIG